MATKHQKSGRACDVRHDARSDALHAFSWTEERLSRAMRPTKEAAAHLDDESLASCLEARESDDMLSHLLYCQLCMERLRRVEAVLLKERRQNDIDEAGRQHKSLPIAFALHVRASKHSPVGERFLETVACSSHVSPLAATAARYADSRSTGSTIATTRVALGEGCPLSSLTLSSDERQRWALRASVRGAQLEIIVRRSGSTVAALHSTEGHVVLADLRPGFLELELRPANGSPSLVLLLLE